MSAPKANFSIDTNFITHIKDIKLHSTGNFDKSSAIKWLKEKEEVDSYGSLKSLCEANLHNEQDHIPVTVWEVLLGELTEEALHLFQNISFKIHCGLKQTTTKPTIVSEEGAGILYHYYTEHDQQLNNQLHPQSRCPEVVAKILLHVYNATQQWGSVNACVSLYTNI